MKSLGHKRGGGNANLRGKLYRLLSCGCCAMINRKHRIKEREDLMETQDSQNELRVDEGTKEY